MNVISSTRNTKNVIYSSRLNPDIKAVRQVMKQTGCNEVTARIAIIQCCGSTNTAISKLKYV